MIADILETLGDGNRPRLVEMGKIKIGGLGDVRKSQNGNAWRAPEKHDHFTVTGLQRGPDKGGARGDLLEDRALMDALAAEGWGDHDGKIRRIPIRVLGDEIDDIMQTAYVWYARSTCGARTDGRKVTWFYNPENNQRYDPPVENDFAPEVLDWQDAKGKPLFKLHSVFNCVIATKAARWGGVYKFRTTSLISFKQLYSSLIHLSQLTGGVLINMPLVLTVRSIQVAPEGKATTVPVVHVELMGSEMHEIQRLALAQAEYRTVYKQKLLVAQEQYRKLLVAPGQESNGEAGDISQEFAPEAQELETPAAPEGGYGLLEGDEPAPPESTDAPALPAPTTPPPVVEVKPAASAAPGPVSYQTASNLLKQKRPPELSEGEVVEGLGRYLRTDLLKGKDIKGKTIPQLWMMLSLDAQYGIKDSLENNSFKWALIL